MNQLRQITSEIRSLLYKHNNSSLSINSSSLRMSLVQFQEKINCMKCVNNEDEGKKKIRDIKNKVENKIRELESQMANTKRNDKKDLESRIKDLRECVKELDVILQGNMKYDVLIDKNKPQFSYDGNIATIKYDGTEGSLLHELKHAFQFETGKIDFIQINNGKGQDIIPGLLYDLTDELESYTRQYAYDGILKFRVVLDVPVNTMISNTADIQKILGEIETNVREIKQMKKITANVIVKIADNIGEKGIYSFISKIPLDSNSLIKDIRKGNEKYRSDFIKGLGLDKEEAQKAYIEFVKVFIQTQPCIYVR
ncbi:hypothetical protein ACF3OE_03515 [Capnocytophaga canis]|uniref:hypothetical protein n=1 Tax=Capnocytophaga canis TaxID=1848903 RepID=UPI00370D8D32